jgi:hypothetical protein
MEMRLGLLRKEEKNNIENVLTQIIRKRINEKANIFARNAIEDLGEISIQKGDTVKITFHFNIENALNFFEIARTGDWKRLEGMIVLDLDS